MNQKEKPVLKANFELEGNSTLRTINHWVRMKTSLMGNYSTGPGLKNLIIMFVLHHFGKPLFRLRVWLSNQYALKARLRKLLKK